jgi:hypothetical protein
MIQIVKMTEDHMKEVIASQTSVRACVTDAHIKALAAYEHSYAAIDVYGRAIGVGGVVEKWPHRVEAWAIIGDNCRKYFLALHNAVKRFLEVFPARRIEATADCDFEQGHRWLELLGFKLECERMVAFNHQGRDASLYSWIKEDI